MTTIDAWMVAEAMGLLGMTAEEAMKQYEAMVSHSDPTSIISTYGD